MTDDEVIENLDRYKRLKDKKMAIEKDLEDASWALEQADRLLTDGQRELIEQLEFEGRGR